MALQPHGIQVYGAFGQSVGEEIDKLTAKGLAREVGTSVTAPTGMRVVTLDELKSLFDKAWYKAWWFWAIVGTTVVGGGGLWYWKRKKR
jgi:LPXTG-motif cell wall-anchored protein